MKLRNLALPLVFLATGGLVVAAYAQKEGRSGSSTSFSKDHRPVDDARLIRARANWFFRQRAYPLSHIPAFARVNAWNVMREMQENQRQYFQQKYGSDYRRLAASSARVADLVNTAASWTPIGPQPTNEYFFQPYISGRVTALAVDPCDPSGNTVFLGGAQGGLWMTVNGGTNWTPLSDNAPSLGVGSLALPSSAPNSAGCIGSVSKTVYVGTGEQNFSADSFYGAGVLTCVTANGTSFSCTPDQTLGAYNSKTNPLDYYAGGAYIGGLAINPQAPSIMLAAVSGFESVLPSGIWCSANSGATWTHVLPASGVLNIDGTAVGFDQAGVAYAALGTFDGSGNLNGVYQTQTASNTPSPLTSCSVASFVQLGGLNNLAGGPAALGRVAMSIYSTSTTSAANDEIFVTAGRGADSSSSLLGIFSSTNGGSSWTQPSTAPLVTSSGGFCNAQCFYDLVIQIDPRNPSVIYAGGAAPFGTGGATVVASTNSGTTWTDVSHNSNSLSGIHVDLHAIAFTPPGDSNDSVYVGTDGGVWSASSPENAPSIGSWTNHNLTLALTQVYPGLSNNPANWRYRSFFGSQDNGSQVLGADLENPSGSPLAWSDTLFCGDGGATAVDPLLPSTVYTECAYIPGVIGAIGRSTLNGNADDSNANPSSTFNESDSGISFSDPGSFIPPFVIDTNATGSTGDAQTLYFGTNRVWQTTNAAASWNAISPDVTGATLGNFITTFCTQNPGYCALTSIAVAKTNSNELLTGSNVDQVYISLNANQGASSTWTDISTGENGTGATMPLTTITDVAIDSRNANLVFATFSGFSGTYSTPNGNVVIPPGHVFLGVVTPGTSPTAVWTDVSSGTGCLAPAGNLPNIPVNAIILDPDHENQLFAATDIGVFFGTLQGTAPAFTGGCWEPLGTGLPNSEVLSLSLNEASRTLIAGTHGRSAWSYALGDEPAFSLGALSPASTTAGASTALTLSLDGTGFSNSSTVNWEPPLGPAMSLTQTTPPAGCSVPTCIAVQVPTNLLSASTVVQVSVTDSGNTTNSLPFTVTSTAPVVNTISPTAGTAGAAINGFTLDGTGFLSTSSINLFTGIDLALPCSPLAPLTETSTQLTANVSASCLQYGGIFFAVVTNPSPGGGSSNPNLVAAAGPAGVACTGMNPPGCLVTVTAAAPANDNFSSATAISANTFATTEDTSGATTDGTPILSNCTTGEAANGDAKSVWFKYTPSAAVTAEADTIGSDYDTILSVWTGSSASSLSIVACNDDINPGVNRLSQITGLALSANTTYYFMVSTYGIPVYDGAGNRTSILSDGGKLTFNFTASTSASFTYSSSSSPPNPSSFVAGNSTSTTLTFSPSSGSGTVTLGACTSSPSTSTITCSYNPGSLTLSGSTSGSSVATIDTVSRSDVPPAGPFRAPPLVWLVVFLSAASLAAFFLRRRLAANGPLPARSAALAAVGFALLAGALLFSGACGGGGSSSGGGSHGTPAGTYTVTIPVSPTPSNGNPSVTFTVQ